MSKKKFNNSGIVYSTNPDLINQEDDHEKPGETLPVHEQKIKIQLDKKQRAGKVVTLIYGFTETHDDIEKIGKEIKKFCGTGGSSKNGEVLIQGDFREKALQWLQKNGYKKAKII